MLFGLFSSIWHTLRLLLLIICFSLQIVNMPDIVSLMHIFSITLLSDLGRLVCFTFNVTFTQIRDKTLQNQTFLPQCCVRSERSRVKVYRTRQCNQTWSAITHKVHLTTGHLVKLKTRHLCHTYSLGHITPCKSYWL